MTVISRAEFELRYLAMFNRLFLIEASGACVVRHASSWELLEFPKMTLTAWSADFETFDATLKFIAPVTDVDHFVLTEIESLKKFSETQIVLTDRSSVEELWGKSHLPHFKTACFDESANWCAIFDGDTDRADFYRSRSSCAKDEAIHST